MKVTNEQRYKEYLNNFERDIDIKINKAIQLLKDKLEESHADGYIIGMSGGVDCSTVAGLCAKGNIPCYLVSLPCGESMVGTQENDSKLLAETFNLQLIQHNIQPIVLDIEDAQKHVDESMVYKTNKGNEDMAYANIAPRVRMTVLYNLAQTHNLLVLGTSNASEIVMGYFTKWGDGAADVEPIKDYTKTEVRIIAKHVGVPQRIIDKAPSADLWDGQTDEEEMGLTYDEIDRYIICGTVNEDVDKKIEKTVRKTQHKRTMLI